MKLKIICSVDLSSFESVPLVSHSRDATHSKNRLIRNIYIRLKEDDILSKAASAVKAVASSKYLYRSSVMSPFELSTRYSNPIDDHPIQVSDATVKADQDVQERRKRARILQSKAIF